MTHLSSESDRGLIKSFLLRISNIARDDSVEGQAVVRLLELDSILLCLDCELTADSILNVEDCRVERIGVKGAGHCCWTRTSVQTRSSMQE